MNNPNTIKKGVSRYYNAFFHITHHPSSIIHITKLGILFFLVSFAFFPCSISAQCTVPSDAERLMDNCSGQIGDNVFLKSYWIKLKKGKKDKPNRTMYTYLFTFGKKYKIVACVVEGSKQKLIVDLYNTGGLVASTYDPATKTNLHGIEFTCMKTGMYTLYFYFDGNDEGCGVSVLSFKQM